MPGNQKGKDEKSPFSGRRVRNYQAPIDRWFYHPALRDGRFSMWDVPAMLQDNAISIGLMTIYGALAGATWEVRANSPDIKTFVENTLYRFWHHDLMKVLQSYVPFGSAVGEVLYEVDDKGLWRYAGLDVFSIRDVTAFKRGRNLTRVSVSQGSMGLVPIGISERDGELRPNELTHPKIFWVGHRPTYGELYGRSALEASWAPWMEKVGTHGALSIRKLWCFANAFRGCWVRYPTGSTRKADGTIVDNQDIAREIAEGCLTGHAGAIPSSVVDGVQEWEIVDPRINGEIKGMIEYPNSLDREIWQGMGILDEVIHAPDTGGSWSGRSGPLLIFLNIEDMRVREIITAFDVGPSGYTTRSDQSGGVIRNLVLENFGKNAKYEIRPISLVPKPAEPGAGGTPQSAPAAAGGGGSPPKPPSAPSGAPMGDPPGPKGMGGAPTQPAGPRPLKLSQGDCFDVELSDEEVNEILGNVSLSAWDHTKHPRGQPENKGWFAPIQDRVKEQSEKVAFSDEVAPARGVEVERGDYDAIEARMTPDEREKMAAEMAEWKDEYVDNTIYDHDLRYDTDDATDDDLAEANGYSDGECKDDFEAMIQENGGDQKERLAKEFDDWYWSDEDQKHGMSFIGPATEAMTDQPVELADALMNYRIQCEEAIGEARDKEKQRQEDAHRAEIARSWDEDDARIEYLRDFYNNHPDRWKESTDLPEQNTWFDTDGGESAYQFKTRDGAGYFIEATGLDYVGMEATEIRFCDEDGEFRVTGVGGAHEVFGKVVPAVAAYVAHKQPQTIVFSASEPSRKRLYNRIVKSVGTVAPEYTAMTIEAEKGPRYYVLTKDADQARKALESHNLAPMSLSTAEESIDPAWWTEEAWPELDDVSLSNGLFDDLHPRGAKGMFTYKPIKASDVKAAQKAMKAGKLTVEKSEEPIISDASGAEIHHFVTLEGGEQVHPDELHRLKIEDGETVLDHDEGLTIHASDGKSKATSLNRALGHLSLYTHKDPNEPITIASKHGYSATRPRSEWMEMHAGSKKIPANDLPAVAKRIVDAGQTLHDTFGYQPNPATMHKVYLVDVYDAVKNDLDGDVTLTDFKKLAVKLNQKGLINLSRADLVGGASLPEEQNRWMREKISDSEAKQMDATFHSVQIPRTKEPPKPRVNRDPNQSFSEWYDKEGHVHTGRKVEHQGGAIEASEEESERFFAPTTGGQKRLDWDAPKEVDHAANLSAMREDIAKHSYEDIDQAFSDLSKLSTSEVEKIAEQVYGTKMGRGKKAILENMRTRMRELKHTTERVEGIKLSVDATGHKHKDKGPGGGQFTSNEGYAKHDTIGSFWKANHFTPTDAVVTQVVPRIEAIFDQRASKLKLDKQNIIDQLLEEGEKSAAQAWHDLERHDETGEDTGFSIDELFSNSDSVHRGMNRVAASTLNSIDPNPIGGEEESIWGGEENLWEDAVSDVFRLKCYKALMARKDEVMALLNKAEAKAKRRKEDDDEGEDDDISLSVDATGHKHKDKGAGGGQFTSGDGSPAAGPKKPTKHSPKKPHPQNDRQRKPVARKEEATEEEVFDVELADEDVPHVRLDKIKVSGKVSPGHVASVTKAVQALPADHRAFLESKGVSVQASEFHPRFDAAGGVFENNTAFVNEKYKQLSLKRQIGKKGFKLANAWQSRHTTWHELGHAMDEKLGNISSSPGFLHALNKDIENLDPASRAVYGDLQAIHKGPDEKFADLYMTLVGKQVGEKSIRLDYFAQKFPHSLKAMDDAIRSRISATTTRPVSLSVDATGHKHKDKGVGGGQFTSGDASNATGTSSKADVPAEPEKQAKPEEKPAENTPIAKVDEKKGIVQKIKSMGSAAFQKLPVPVQKAVTGALAVMFSGWTASQKFAEQIAREKGASEEDAAKIRSTLASWDTALYYPTMIATAPMGGAVGAATWVVPPVTGLYLLHSTAVHPVATALAAFHLASQAAHTIGHVVNTHTVQLSSSANTPQMALADALEKHGFDDWYTAILHGAILATKNCRKALQVAEKVYQEHPKDVSQPKEGDTDRLFAKPKDAKLSATWDEDKHKRDEGGKFAANGTKSKAFKSWFGDSKVVNDKGEPLRVFHGTPSRGSESNNRYVRAEQANDEYPGFDAFSTDREGISDSGWLGRGAYFTPDPDFAHEFGDKIMPCYLSIKNPFVIHDDSSNGRGNIFRFLKSVQHLDGLPDHLKIDATLEPEQKWTDYSGNERINYLRVSEPYKKDGKEQFCVLMSFRPGDDGGVVESTGSTREEAIWAFKNKDNHSTHGFLLHIIKEIGAKNFTEMLKKAGHDGVMNFHVDDDGTKPRLSEVLAFHPNQIKSASGNKGTFDPNEANINLSATWDESKHHRGQPGNAGEFGPGGAGGGAKTAAAPAEQPTPQQAAPNQPAAPGASAANETPTPPTLKFLGGTQAKAQQRGQESLAKLVNSPHWKGPKGAEGVQAAKASIDKAFASAEVTANMPHEFLAKVMDSGKYKSAYELGSRDKKYMATRANQEKAVFGAGDMSPQDRPKYLAVNWGGNKYGAASMYGNACVVFNKDALRERCTVTSGNSFGHRDDSGVSTTENIHHAALHNVGAMKAAGIDPDPSDTSLVPDAYTEVQAWGDMPFDKSTVSEIRLPSMDAAKQGVDQLLAQGQKAGIPVKFFHEDTGEEVSYEHAKGYCAAAAKSQKNQGWLGKIKSLFGGARAEPKPAALSAGGHTYQVVAAQTPTRVVLRDGNNFFLRTPDGHDRKVPWHGGTPEMMVAALVSKWGFHPVQGEPSIQADQAPVLKPSKTPEGSTWVMVETVPYEHAEKSLSATWDESKHHRGQPGNKGQFGSGGGSDTTDHAADYAKNGTRAKAFKAWFGDWENDADNASKVVNAKGEPQETRGITGAGSMVRGKDGKPVAVYHGTMYGGFEAFDEKKVDRTALYGPGFYFTEDAAVATEYTAAKVAPATLPDETASKAVDFLYEHQTNGFFSAAERPGIAKRIKKSAASGDVDWFAEQSGMKPEHAAEWKALFGSHRNERKPEVKSVYLNIRKPFDLDKQKVTAAQLNLPANYIDAKASKTVDGWKAHFDEEGFPREFVGKKEDGAFAYFEKDNKPDGTPDPYAITKHHKFPSHYMRTQIQKLGYDGFTHIGGDRMGGGHHHRVWIAFEPNQIKSVQNKGTFDPNEANINLSAGWDPSKHHRGQPGNKGQFGPGGGESSKKPATDASAPKVAPRDEGEADKAYAKRVIDHLEVSKDDLPEDHAKYFNVEKAAKTVPIDQLVSTKSEEENKQGGANAPARMWAASQGILSKRDPITVRPIEGGKYQVVDGNGTFTAAKGLGWKTLPVQLEEGGEEKGKSPEGKAPPWDDNGSDVVKTHNSLNIPRNQMPNIAADKVPAFLDELRADGVKVESKPMEVGKLKPIQGELSKQQMDVIRKLPAEKKNGAVLVSSDGYILDGHHRWGSLVADDPKNKINAHVIGLPMMELLKAGNSFRGSTRKEAVPSVFTPEESRLPKDANQPIPPDAGYAGLKEKGEEAVKQMQQLLDLGKGVASQLGYETFEAKDDAATVERCKKPGGFLVIAPMKGEKRATEKVKDDYDGDWSKLLDVARSSIVVDSFDDVNQVAAKLRENNIIMARKPKDRITERHPPGYRDCLVNIQMPNGIIGEMQILTKSMMMAKFSPEGHDNYEITRAIDAKMESEDRKDMTPEEEAAYDEAFAAMEVLYDAAWQKDKGSNPAL